MREFTTNKCSNQSTEEKNIAIFLYHASLQLKTNKGTRNFWCLSYHCHSEESILLVIVEWKSKNTRGFPAWWDKETKSPNRNTLTQFKNYIFCKVANISNLQVLENELFSCIPFLHHHIVAQVITAREEDRNG